MKFNLSIIHIFIFCILFSGCNDRDKPFYGDWRANLGSGFITFKKNGSVKYLGKSGSWKTEWNSRFCTYCSNGGKLTLKLSGKSYEFGFSFLSSKRSTNDNKIISLTDQKTKVRNYFTNNGLSIKQFPNTLPSGWAHENKGLMHYEKIEAVYFSANHVFSLVNRVGAEKNQLFKKSGSSWSKVNFGGLKANDSVEDMMVRDQEIFIFTKTGQIIFSANEGKSFESFNQKVPEAYRSNKNFRFDLKTAVFNNTLYAAVTTETDVETEELGPHTQHGLNVYEMIDYNNSARSDWKLIKTFTGKGNGGADLASDGIHLVISFRLSGNGHQVYKTSNGMFWKKEIPSPVKQNNFLILKK